MPEESINIYMSLVDKVSGPLSGIFRGVRAYSTGYVPNPQRDRWKREDRRIGRTRPSGGKKQVRGAHGSRRTASRKALRGEDEPPRNFKFDCPKGPFPSPLRSGRALCGYN